MTTPDLVQSESGDLYARIYAGDTLGHVCHRHGLSRGQFFVLNEHKPVELTEDGVPTTRLHEEEYVRIGVAQTRASAITSANPDGSLTNVSEYKTGSDAAGAGVAVGAIVVGTVVVGGLLTLGWYYLLYRGVKAIATGS